MITIETEQFLRLIDKEISSYDFGNEPTELYEPIRYILSLGGKRIRPVLTLIAYSLYKDDPESIAKPATAIEVFHNFTLLHDDIMDNAPLRRNKATVHEKWNNNVAILSGDVMLVRAYDLLLDSGPERLKEVIKKFNICAAQVCEGQQFDMNFENKERVSEEEYLEMIRLKTAVLLGYSLELGGILADADQKQCELLKSIGQNIGLGFQLKDDLLDVYADQNKFGKQVGGDILANKKTYLLIKAFEMAKDETKERLSQWLDRKDFAPEEKVMAITKIYDELNVKDITEKAMNEYFYQGISGIDRLEGNDNYKSLLKTTFNQLINRDK